MTTPFTDKLLRDWFFEVTVTDVLEETIVSNMGYGPFAEDDFDDLLYRYGITVHVNGPETEVIVVGREEWREEDLYDLLEQRAGKTRHTARGNDLGARPAGRDGR